MKINKKARIALSIFAIILCISSTLLAATIETDSITSSMDLGDADDQIETIGSKIFTAISNVGIVASVVVVAILGVKYMLGSVDERAEYKKSMMPYLIGAFLVFGASIIGKAVYNAFSNL